MEKRRVLARMCLGGLLLLLVACGGAQDGSPATSSSGSPSASPSDEQSEKAVDSSLPPDPRAPRTRAPVGRGAGGAVPDPTIAADPVGFDAPLSYEDGVAVEVLSVAADRLEGRGPGELRGDVTVVDLRIDNGSDRTLSLNSVVVSLDYGAKPSRSASTTSLDSTQDISGSLRPGKQARASFVFMVAEPKTSRARLTVDIDGQRVPATFLRGGYTN